MLASLLFPYDNDAPALIDVWMAELEREGCVIRYKIDGTTYLQVCNWLNHQKIDKPSPSKIPDFDESSRILANPREHSSVDQGPKDQGVDQGPRTKDQLPSPTASRTPKPEKSETGLQADCREVWQAFAAAYFDRYQTKPIRNAKVNSAIKGFVQRIGGEEAPHVAAFYVSHNDIAYVRSCHDTGLMLMGAEKLRTEWITNRKVTSISARQTERAGAMADTVNSILAERA